MNLVSMFDEKPFVIGESQAFDHFVRSSLQPAYRLVSRGVLKKRINSCFTNTYTELLNYLATFKERIRVTCDLCSYPFQENFLGVTCHWIDEKWNV